MSQKTVKALAQALAEQQWMLTQLVSRLVELGILQSGEIKALADRNPAAKAEFAHDYLDYLVSIGLENQ